MELFRRRGDLVFPSPITATKPISDMALLNALRIRLGYAKEEMSIHGFRAMARTMLDERLEFAPDVIEVQLAHKIPGPLGDTYNRSLHLSKRKKMMQAWADYLDEIKKPGADMEAITKKYTFRG
jgi:integrase